MPRSENNEDPVGRPRFDPLNIPEYPQIPVKPPSRFKIYTDIIVREEFIFEMTDQVITQTTPNMLRVVQLDKFGNNSLLLENSFGHKPFNRIRMVVKTGFETDILLTVFMA